LETVVVDLGADAEFLQTAQPVQRCIKGSVVTAEPVMRDPVSAIETDSDPYDSCILNAGGHGFVHQGSVGSQGHAQVSGHRMPGDLEDIAAPQGFAATQHQDQRGVPGNLIDDAQALPSGKVVRTHQLRGAGPAVDATGGCSRW
jgi:hypothetical protein